MQEDSMVCRPNDNASFPLDVYLYHHVFDGQTRQQNSSEGNDSTGIAYRNKQGSIQMTSREFSSSLQIARHRRSNQESGGGALASSRPALPRRPRPG
jgi:hypothetical protein